MISVTREMIEQLRTPAGGFNEATMSIIGYWPLQSAWKERLIGAKISDRNWKAMVRAAKQGAAHRFRGNTKRII